MKRTQDAAIGPLPASKTQSDTGSAGFVKYDASSFSSSLGLLRQASFGYFATLGGGNAGPNYIPDAGGTFRFDNGAGARMLSRSAA